MDYAKLTPERLIDELSAVGRYPSPELIEAIYEKREETEPLLLNLFRLAFHDSWFDDEDPRWYRFLHAGKFLLSWQNLESLPIFADLFADDELQDLCEWYEEDLFHFGPPAIPHLARVLAKDSAGKWHFGRALAGSTLTRIAEYYPDTREEIVTLFRSFLPTPDEVSPGEIDSMWGDFAHELGTLADESSRDLILALDDKGVLDSDFFEHQTYLINLKHGFKAQTPPRPYDIRPEYQGRYEYHQQQLQREASERKRQERLDIRPSQSRTGPKVGRNEPCPCGSGKKYKHCHGRPGA